MDLWSAENATNAYLRTVKMGKNAKEPDVSEFISALAAGRNAQLMVMACGNAADSTTQALVAAAYQTGGKVVCILCGRNELPLSMENLGESAMHVEFVIGDARLLLASEYREADCIVIDCGLKNCDQILERAREMGRDAMVLAYNAFRMGSWDCLGFDAHLLPIGEGLLVGRMAKNGRRSSVRSGKRSRWIVKIDECTGEEHVFRVRP